MKQSSQHDHKLSWQKSVLIAFLVCTVNSAWAQYVWLDDKGVKQFSDTPPPPNTPKNRIIKGPAPATPEKIRAAVNQDSSASAVASASAAASAKAGPLTTAERNAEYNKRKQEQAEKEKKDAAEAEQRVARQRNCEAARAHQRDLDSGVRIGQIDKNGERSFLTDEQKAQKSRENRKILDGCQ
jgi:hypothetical protein